MSAASVSWIIASVVHPVAGDCKEPYDMTNVAFSSKLLFTKW